MLERDRIASSWRHQRWDEFCLVTPNWQCRLPGYHYPGSDPDGFMLRDDIVAFVEEYAALTAPPVYEGVNVLRGLRSILGEDVSRGGDVRPARARGRRLPPRFDSAPWVIGCRAR